MAKDSSQREQTSQVNISDKSEQIMVELNSKNAEIYNCSSRAPVECDIVYPTDSRSDKHDNGDLAVDISFIQEVLLNLIIELQ